jgi:outer membrane protein assembly factor BamB
MNLPRPLRPTRMRPRPLLLGIVGLCWIVCGHAARGEDWPQWRGPTGDGTSRETGLPLHWDETHGVAWKTAIPEWGNSTPAIWRDAIFLTAQTDDERLLLVKIARATGRIEWTREVGRGQAEHLPPRYKKTDDDRGRPIFHTTQNLASPSPVTDGQLVVVHFGNGDLAAYDFAGHRLWRRNLQDDHGRYTIWWGHANSPVLCGDLVISVCMQDSLVDLGKPASPSYVVAHDKRTGVERWKTMRPTNATAEPCDAYTTPLLWQRGGRPEVVVMGGLILDAYDPQSGRRVWHLPELEGNRVITSPVIANGVIYLTQGMRRPLLAVRPGGDGQRGPNDVLWRHTEGTPDSPTPTVSGGLLFLVTDQGIAKCLDARSGQVQWAERLKGAYRASPLAADGRIYFLNTKGLTTVVAARRQFQRLAENPLDDTMFASPVAVDGRLYLRGNKSLYAIRALAQ